MPSRTKKRNHVRPAGGSSEAKDYLHDGEPLADTTSYGETHPASWHGQALL